MKKVLFASIFLAILIVAPSSTHAGISIDLKGSGKAYTTTAQRAQQISETTTLYSIDFWLGHGSHDFYVPVGGKRNQAWGTESDYIGFEVLEDSKTRVDDGVATAVVIANAPITSDGMYKINKGSKKKLTLFVALTLPEDAPEADYAIHVTDLPFYRNDDREYQRLNPSELTPYTTPEVEFNAQNPSK